ncbi:energy-coupling factor ABC transporter ATP-binding protein [Peribacillus butanolivorans]|uniref:ABC transporter ATP-binding protein n=1 Tax=Peribacillus butanolivorans TaxID=421767 RepID=A0ABM6XHF1_9BACI|nr:ABC transporter ATP-binding protein [Peribacillus butanolivorans]AXN37710.1 ABC transporter ATP-binding protein [Peribacillus butanolivorans]MCO0597874.1 energy-coupling factor ABC transporter ATP-binding protein [Peribacillus butanolivorans]
MNDIELKNVSYKYPLSESFALKDFHFTFKKGKFYGIIGSNSGGKTTLCNLVRGLIPHFYQGDLSGEVLIEGTDVREWDSQLLSTKIGYIFQNPFTQISGVRETVLEEIALGLENLGVEKDEMIDRVIDVVKLLKIEDLIKKNPNNLSGGQRQRVAFASIIAMNNDILVIDEPTSQLDPETTSDVFEIINMLKAQGKTILLVEHKVDLIAEYSDEVIVMEKGQMVYNGSPSEVFSNKDLLSRGAAFPQVALLSHEMKMLDKPFDYITITKSQAKEQIMKRMGL